MRASRLQTTLAIAIGVLATLPAIAENVDPDGTGRHFAYSENLGWINAQPTGEGGPGMHVDDLFVTGWLWSENAAWINLSCTNRGTCATFDYGVLNDGAGNLSGFAWAENLGWIRFAGPGFGVTIDPASGDFSGHAWSENAGWITFGAAAPTPYGINTSWRCGEACFVEPVLFAEEKKLCWLPLSGATDYEVVSSLDPTFAGGCASSTTAATCTNPPAPAPSETRFTLVRVTAPTAGSWGVDSNGALREPCP